MFTLVCFYRRIGAGKTCLMLKFSNGTFNSDFISTIGVDFKAKNVKISDKVVRIQVIGFIYLH
jgi:GTPase SAR1 family protein